MASLAITDICVDSACTIKTDAKIYKDYRSSPQEVTNPSEASLNVNCLQYIWYEVEMIQHSAGYRVENFNIYTDFGTVPTGVAEPVSITISPFSPEVSNRGNIFGYRSGEELFTDSTFDVTECNVQSFESNMRQVAKFSCFDASIYLAGDDCSTRYGKINQKIINTGFYDPEYKAYPAIYEGANFDVTTVKVQETIDHSATPAGLCELPSRLEYTFLYQEKDGLHRLEGVQIREVTRLFQLAEAYRLTINVDFVKRLTRTETSWQNPFEDYLLELKYSSAYTPDPIFLLIIIVSSLLPIVIYLYIDRDVHLRTLKLVN